MNSEEDEFRRIEREALRRVQDDDDDTQGYASEFALPQLRQFLDSLRDRIARRYRGSVKDQHIALGMEIVFVDLIDLIEGKK
jgi:CRISPR/Cas system CSM-associated protein Csm2 small subunit